MAYRLKSKESIPKGIKRIVHEEIASALGSLNGEASAAHGGPIHEARKSVKKIRGVLRLAQPELGRRYRSENLRLRDAARKLTDFRDAEALVEVFDSLTDGRGSFDSVRKALVRRKEQMLRGVKMTEVFGGISDGLRAADKRVEEWPLRKKGFAALVPGLEKTFRRGRRALAAVRKRPRPECFHAWRKRVKDHWYHTRLLESLWPDPMRARERSLKDLEGWLGDDHNLVLLRKEIAAQPEKYGGKREIDRLLARIDRRQKELRENALSLGGRLYGEKPRQFTLRMRNLWRAWQKQPKSLKKLLKAEAGGRQ